MQGSASDPLRKIQARQAPDTKVDIGSILKAARQQRGQSIEGVVSHTRIPKKFVEALEGNRLDEFPALAYLRGFLKTYCDYLEVDFEALWKLIAPPPPEAPEDAAKAQVRPVGKSLSREHSSDGPPLAAMAVLGGATLLAALLAFGLRRRGIESEERPAPTPAALEPIQNAPQSILTLEFREDVWASVAADGRTVYEGRVPRNSRQEWKARKTLLLRTTAPESLRLTLNGNKFALPAPNAQGAYRIEVP